MKHETDDDLRADFQALRADVEASDGVPSFDAMFSRAKAEAASPEAAAGGAAVTNDLERARRRRAFPVAPWIPLAAAAAVATILLVGLPGPDGDAEFERLVADYSTTATAWRSPTASLLEIPGVDLGAVPSIGTGLPSFDLPEADAPQGRDS